MRITELWYMSIQIFITWILQTHLYEARNRPKVTRQNACYKTYYGKLEEKPHVGITVTLHPFGHTSRNSRGKFQNRVEPCPPHPLLSPLLTPLWATVPPRLPSVATRWLTVLSRPPPPSSARCSRSRSPCPSSTPPSRPRATWSTSPR
jgi:hypothetical protein